MNLNQITCRRCKGKCVVDSPVMYAGIPGGCFSCSATGKVYVDKFAREFANVKGDFYGFSRTDRFGMTTKQISRNVESDLLVTRDTTFKKLTEEQAFAFFSKYGREVKFPAKAA